MMSAHGPQNKGFCPRPCTHSTWWCCQCCASGLVLVALVELVLRVELVLLVQVLVELPVELVLVVPVLPSLLVVAQPAGSCPCPATPWGWLLCWQPAPGSAH